MTDAINTSVSKLQVDENGIVHMEFPEKNQPILLEDSKGIYEGRMQLQSAAGSKQLLLVDLRTSPKPDREARDYARSSEVVESTMAMAILVQGPMSKVLGNFFMGFNRGDFPVRLFTDKSIAIDWLVDQKQP